MHDPETARSPQATDTAAVLDPDVRFLLANERTLLAWIRTALTCLAGGIVLLHIGGSPGVQASFGVTAMVLGAIMAAVGYVRYRAADRAIRAARLPAPGYGPVVQVVGVVVFALAVAALGVSGVLY